MPDRLRVCGRPPCGASLKHLDLGVGVRHAINGCRMTPVIVNTPEFERRSGRPGGPVRAATSTHACGMRSVRTYGRIKGLRQSARIPRFVGSCGDEGVSSMLEGACRDAEVSVDTS